MTLEGIANLANGQEIPPFERPVRGNLARDVMLNLSESLCAKSTFAERTFTPS
jgi:hypothetical protein